MSRIKVNPDYGYWLDTIYGGFMRSLIYVLVYIFVVFSYANAEPTKNLKSQDYSETLAALLSSDVASIDLTKSKLVIDNLVDPTVNIEAQNIELEAIATTLLSQMGAMDDAVSKIDVIRSYIYKSGHLNNDQKYNYDFEDPNGRLAASKTLKKYMVTRKGNCVNMPIFFLALAEKMSVDLNITTAPRHIFIQFDNPTTGKVEHLEATSGGQPQRIVWQRQIMPMTDTAIKHGMYMKRLDKREMVAVMAETLLQDLAQKNELDERLEVAELVHRAYPQFDVALMHLADGYQLKIIRDFQSKYPRIENIPEKRLPELQNLAGRRDYAETLLRDLGWRRAKPNPNVILPK